MRLRTAYPGLAGLKRAPRPARVLASALAVGLLLVAAAFLVPRYVYSQNVLEGMRGSTAILQFGARPHETVDFLADGVNVSGHTIVLRAISFPRGIPAGLRFTHVAALTGEEATTLYGWPPHPPPGPGNGLAHSHSLRLAGYRVPNGAHFGTMVALVADGPGVYVVGPITFHVDVLGVPALPDGRVPAQVTEPQHFVLCVNVSNDHCEAASSGATAP